MTRTLHAACLLIALVALPATAVAGEWTHWRGPNQTGVADDSGLPSTWSRDGENLIWRADFTGRSTPVVFDGRVCATGRVADGVDMQEIAACWNAETGEKLWEHRWTVFLTTVPFTRVSWGDPAADSETGYLFVQGVNGLVFAFDRDGEVVWSWRMYEDLGRYSGYGGRTNSPIVDEDRVIFHSVSSMWGPNKPPGDRYVAFDKRTGEILWLTNRNAGPAKDLNTYSTPVVAMLGGQRQLITGGADGWIRALNARTGEDIWKFHLSQRGLNASPVVDGDTVYVNHGEENVDEGLMGRIVAIDGTGTGDVTKTHEKWRLNEITAGFVSPTLHDGVLYVGDNSATILAIDAATGEELWEHNYGTVGKGSPVYADGKLYVTEVNGNVVIIEVGEEGAKTLDKEYIEMPDGTRYAEIYGSVAVGYGRVYFTTEEGVYSVGDKSRPFEAKVDGPRDMDEGKPAAGAKPSTLRVVPGVAVANASETLEFRVNLFDDKGRSLGDTRDVEWSLNGLPGTVTKNGTVTFDGSKFSGTHVGTVTAKWGDIEASSHLRIAGPLPWKEDFSGVDIGKTPASWLGTIKKANVVELDGDKVLQQPNPNRGAPRATLLTGPASMSGYTIQADLRGSKKGRRFTDVGVVNSGYTVELQGGHQRIKIGSWSSENRMAKQQDFAWEMDTWYTLKVRVDIEGQGATAKAVIRGKAWKRGEDEPAEWTITAEDPHPIRHGSPGLYAFAPVDAYFDNVMVTASH